MTRVGYDADTQRYTFRDADGSLWESAEGSRYGTLHRGIPPLLNPRSVPQTPPLTARVPPSSRRRLRVPPGP
jgi:hypothetical protein